MEYKGRKVLVKWSAYIETIKAKEVIACLHEKYPEDSLIKECINLPINMIDEKHLRLGMCFYLYLTSFGLEIEWFPDREWTKEELDEVNKEAEELDKNIKWE